MSVLLLCNAHVIDAVGAVHESVLICDGKITALGGSLQVRETAQAQFGHHRVRCVDLEGSVVTAGFVDAHVHLTATGQLFSGIDLRDVRSSVELLAVLQSAPSSGAGVLIGHGWDETAFDDAALPTADELQAATGREVYLTRVDVHSALVSRSLLKRLQDVEAMSGFTPTGRLSREAHGAARQYVFSTLTPQQRRDLQSAALLNFAKAGIVSVHENAGPVVSGEADLASALELGTRQGLPEVIGYWGELHSATRVRDLGAWGAAGDLFIDGSLGSHTAHLCHEYSDVKSLGACYVSKDELSAHFAECRAQGVQAGVHAIGDAAIDAALGAMAAAVQQQPSRVLDGNTLRRGQWRIEHLEMPSSAHIAMCAAMGVIASVQPQFDALWGGAQGMYQQRLGAKRVAGMNPFAQLHNAGVHLAFGSDSPVTPALPWRTIRAAIEHHRPEQRLQPLVAFTAHTSAAASAAVPPLGITPDLRVAARLEVGQPADMTVWPLPPSGHERMRLQSQAEWLITELASAEPAALATIRAGGLIHDEGLLS